MRHALQVALIERALRLVETGGSERRAASTSPLSRYLDPERHAREIEAVFRRHPVALCASGDLAGPGASLAIDVAGLPLLLVRGDDGVVRGFVNACRHRGARLQATGPATQRTFVCPYHSWTYALDGALRGRPHDGDFPHAAPADCALAAVPAGEALGCVWAVARRCAPGESPRLDLASWLGPFGEDLRDWGYDTWVPFFHRAFDNAANWKIPLEGNLETYHFQYAHRTTIAHLFHDNLLLADLDRHGTVHHQRLVLPKRTLPSLRGRPQEEWELGRHANLIYFFFPSTFVLHEGDHCNLFTVLPETVSTSRVLGLTLIPRPPDGEKALRHWQRNVEIFWGALDEDFALAASSQSTLASGANPELRFGATEWCSAQFHADVEAALAQARAQPGG